MIYSKYCMFYVKHEPAWLYTSFSVKTQSWKTNWNAILSSVEYKIGIFDLIVNHTKRPAKPKAR